MATVFKATTSVYETPLGKPIARFPCSPTLPKLSCISASVSPLSFFDFNLPLSLLPVGSNILYHGRLSHAPLPPSSIVLCGWMGQVGCIFQTEPRTL